jgi:lipid-A-disaccharide synthase
MRVFISAGEPSGDLHGGNLVAALKERLPGAELVGFGGPRMAAAGVDLMYPLTELAVMWLGRVLLKLPTFFHLGAKAESYFRTQRPDALVLIDYPGFHWHLAQRAHRYGVPVYYFVPPQLWAWRGSRVKKVRKYFRAVLTALPFEEEWYRSRGVRTRYVGHPYFDEIAGQKLDPAFMAEQRAKPGDIVALLPGSRTQEVTGNVPDMVTAAGRIVAARPNTRFLVAAFREKHAAFIRQHLAGSSLPIEVHVGRTPEIIELCKCCVAVSGSVGLELLVRRKPSVVVYRSGRLMEFVARRVATCKYLSLANLLADEELFPEFPGATDPTGRVTETILNWLTDETARAALVAKLDALCIRVAVPGAVNRAADFLASELTHSQPEGLSLPAQGLALGNVGE